VPYAGGEGGFSALRKRAGVSPEQHTVLARAVLCVEITLLRLQDWRCQSVARAQGKVDGSSSMGRVMIIGYGPLPRAGLTHMAAAALRTRQFLKPILAAGHTVNLYTLPMPGTEGPDAEVSGMIPDNYEGLTYQRFTNHSGEFAIRMLTEQARQLMPDAILGVNMYPSYVGAMMATTIPLWADLNGSWMAETAGRCWADKDDARLADAWAIERVIVRRLDKYSAVTRAQLQMTVGELASVGRMNQYTFNYQFGHAIPNAAYRWPSAPIGDGEEGPILRGPRVPIDAFIVLWSGGFKLSSDVETLVKTMDILMERYPGVHFVSTGGRTEGSSARTYQHFEDLVQSSPFKDRYHLLGWVDSRKLPRIYREADVGLNVDLANYETMLGARNRLNAMAAEELALATTMGTEISEWLDDAHGAMTAAIGDAEGLAAAIEPWIEQREELVVFANNARKTMEADFTPEHTTRALLAWLRQPRLAPDNEEKIRKTGEGVTDLNAITINPLEEEAFLLMRHRPRELRQALDDAETLRAQRGKRGIFGFGKS
jgi:glycosyltransferase involved in cell wall biosynthesis